MQLLGILIACAVLVGIVVLYYHYFDPMHIEEEEEQNVEAEETPEERARVIAEHERKIEEAKIEESTEIYSEQ